MIDRWTKLIKDLSPAIKLYKQICNDPESKEILNMMVISS